MFVFCRVNSIAVVSVALCLACCCYATSLEQKQQHQQQRRNHHLRQLRGINTLQLQQEQEQDRSLIVGGTDADEYPRSIVFLSDRVDNLACGGSLISPTIVLAAGHCEVSLVTHAVFERYDHPKERLENGLGIFSKWETRIPVRTEILHPDYDRSNLENDVMLLVLEYSPNDVNGSQENKNIPYMRLHTPDDIPLEDLVTKSSNNNNKSPKTTNLELLAVGWGHTSGGESGKAAETLQEVTLNYVQNDECKTAREDAFVNYEDRITDEMMCTFAQERDTCHGDSGGPILLDLGNPIDAKDFVQVGIVSWGEDCADHIFPGVASRVAAAFPWIRDRVCSIDGDAAPFYFGCDSFHTYSPAPSSSPTTIDDALLAAFRTEQESVVLNNINNNNNNNNNNNKVDVEIEILLDVFATETSWSLTETKTKIVVVNVPFGTYRHDNQATVTVRLTRGFSYKFTILDKYGDGITNKGAYRIYVVDKTKADRVGAILVSAPADFEEARSHTFRVPAQEPPPSPPTRRSTTPRKRLGDEFRVGTLSEATP